ncbi:MAG TPA: hypothetical protein VMW40_05760 [Candidatus Bathyarchaeia archaeon]|nr:hypothetical protein [Candidatus Bathyarchaeia archaeon]
MTKFLLLWEMDISRAPLDPKERLAGWATLLNMVKDDLESGKLKDWGVFPGENAGYAIVEGTELDVLTGTERYVPFLQFETHSVLSLSQVMEGMKALSQA